MPNWKKVVVSGSDALISHLTASGGIKGDTITGTIAGTGVVDTTQLAADAVTGAKIADEAIDSDHYVDGSIDTAHIADNQITGDKLADSFTVAANLTVAGNLIVQGATTEVQTTNLNVEDQFILLNSGSINKDTGIIFGGTHGTANTGKALLWDHAANHGGGADGRLAVKTNATAANNTTAFASGSTGYYLAGVFQGSTADAATALADHAGNIRIESNELFMYF